MAFPFLLSTGVKVIDIIITILSVFVSICTGTYIFSECRFWIQSRGTAGRFEGREPLTLPYSIPYLAGFPRLLNPHALYKYALHKAPQNAPVQLSVGPISIYILFGEKNMKMIFKNSKVLGKDSISEHTMRGSGMKPEDVNIFTSDTSGIGTVPTKEIPDEKRIWKNTRDTKASYLTSGPAVTQLTNGFMKTFIKDLNRKPKDYSFTVPLWDYVKKAMFVASTTTLAGEEIFNVNPDLANTYWDYDESFLLIAVGLPRWIYWRGHARRNRMLKSAERWLTSAYAKFDERDKHSEWEPLFGSAFMRNMFFDMRNAGVTTHGQAAGILLMIWGINSNAIPCTVWMLLETLQRPGLIQRLRSEIAPTTSTTPQGELSISVPRLMIECPLLSSIYQECLRIRASNTVTRQLEEDLECDGYVLKKGRYLMSPSWLPMHGPLWDIPDHPATEFWPERFIEMPKLAFKDEEGKSNFDTAMRPDNWFPYGGGNMICPGRFFAKQEILLAAALLIMKFDFEPQGWVTHGGKKSNRAARPDEAFAGAGILPPDRDLLVTMRRVR